MDSSHAVTEETVDSGVELYSSTAAEKYSQIAILLETHSTGVVAEDTNVDMVKVEQ